MKYALLVLCVVGLVGCGSSSSPTTPTPVPTPTPTPQPAPPPATPFQGVFIGTWTKVSCTESGSGAAGACAGFPTGGGLSLTLTQSGSVAQGTATIGAFQLAVTGPISSAGELTLTGQAHQSATTVNLSAWRTVIAGNLMTGSFAYTIAPDDVRLGLIVVQAGLQSVVKQ